MQTNESSNVKTVQNIKLLYLISFLSNSYFWWSIWLLYYLRFTDNTGVGLLIAITTITTVLFEMPTGAIADIIGQKRSLTIAFILVAIGEAIMGGSIGLATVIVSIFLIGIGHTFSSGSFEAIIYDTLKENHLEKTYQKILAHTRSISSITYIFASILGGFLYAINPRIPFFLTSAFFLVAALISLKLKEPATAKRENKVSLKNTFVQLEHGVKHLMAKSFRSISIGLILIGIFAVIGYELIDDYVTVKSIINPEYLGFAYAGISLVAAIASQLIPKITKRFGNIRTLILVSIIIALTLIFTPMLGAIFALVFVYLRVAGQVFAGNISSTLINDNTPSEDRATTLSTFNMITQLPLVILAPVIGGLISFSGAYVVSMWIGVIGLIILTIYLSGIKAKDLIPLRKSR